MFPKMLDTTARKNATKNNVEVTFISQNILETLGFKAAAI
jgi:hypothetical protein